MKIFVLGLKSGRQINIDVTGTADEKCSVLEFLEKHGDEYWYEDVKGTTVSIEQIESIEVLEMSQEELGHDNFILDIPKPSNEVLELARKFKNIIK